MKRSEQLLHRLWSKAAGLDGYDKGEWMELQKELEGAAPCEREPVKRADPTKLIGVSLRVEDWPMPQIEAAQRLILPGLRREMRGGSTTTCEPWHKFYRHVPFARHADIIGLAELFARDIDAALRMLQFRSPYDEPERWTLEHLVPAPRLASDLGLVVVRDRATRPYVTLAAYCRVTEDPRR